ncbi:PIR protein [Plasmodium vivax]|uniref:VIR protein n=1 Tax=Plasmodium vivax TaxID=5855 RepID=A0A565A892_PLAVI|nr:PIR protein [Plasmodium vivax]
MIIILKKKFSNDYHENDGLKPNELLDDPEFNNSKRNMFRPIFVELLKHIRNSGVFMDGQQKPCSYISYILAKDLQTKGHEYKSETFEMFLKFLNKYSTLTRNTANICSTSLVYVHSDIYDKMKKLYELYELYDDHLTKIKVLSDPNSCPSITSFLHQYNDFIKQHQPTTNNNYKKILDHFEEIINDRVQIYIRNTLCPQTYLHLEEIKLPKVEKPKESVQIVHQPNHAEYQEPPAKSLPPHVQLQATREETRTYRAESERAHEPPQPPHEETLPFQETLAQNAHHAERQQVQEFPHRVTDERELQVDISRMNPQPYGSFESSGASSYSEHNPYLPVQPSSKEVGDTSSSVMSTITSALRDVEPGPVLGVSGGMGVLFLLFKYTPVGSFFGGRRGRFHQIPSSFRGFPPGEFPNFNEYEVGHIGYGAMNIPHLAE